MAEPWGVTCVLGEMCVAMLPDAPDLPLTKSGFPGGSNGKEFACNA